MTLQFQTINLPFAAGLGQGIDPRALEAPMLSIATDVQFDEQGGLQTRKPLAAITGTLTDARRIVEYGRELVAFTKDAIYTRFADQSTWIQRATYLAAKVSEQSKHITTGEQLNCDTARLSGMVAHTWTEGTSSGVYLALTDETTGAVTLAPFAVIGSKPKLVALSTKILLFWRNAGGDLVVYAIDPAGDPSTIPAALGSPTTVLAAASFGDVYDATRLPTTDTAVVVCRRDTTTSYTIGTVTSALVVTVATVARSCDSAIAVASTPSGTQVQVVRTTAIGVIGDFITIAGFADVTINQALGTVTNLVQQVTAAYRSTTTGGFYRCYVFWTSDGTTPIKEVRVNYVDTAGTIGTDVQIASMTSVASRAFDYDGHVYVNVLFSESPLQNTYFLYRSPATTGAAPLRIGKAAASRAAARPASMLPLPSVQLTSGTTGFTWCAGERRAIAIDSASNAGYSDHSPRDVTIEFDSNEARRTAILGNTLYFTGAEVMQFDGRQATEVGFPIFPYGLGGSETAGGSIATNGTYSYKMSYRFDNAKGDRERSTTVTIANIPIASAPGGVTFTSSPPLTVTHKTSLITATVAAEYWRTLVDPIVDAPFYLVSGLDPSVTANPNGFVHNAPTGSVLVTFNDEMADTTASSREAHPENGSVLESIAPPPATIIAATADRLFLAGIAGDPDRVWYSKLRGDGEVASFHDALTINIPRQGGPITALAFVNETLVVFRETAIYACTGDGFDNTSGGQNYGPARALSVDVGAVNHESVALFDKGLIFKSSKGWYILNKGWACDYIGSAVCDYDSEAVLAVHVVKAQHQIRCLTGSRMLVLDTLVNQWAEWTIASGLHAAMWNGTYHCLKSTSVLAEQSTYSGIDYGMDVETAWIKLSDLQGAGSVRWLTILGEYRGVHGLQVRLSRDYLQDGAGAWTYYQNETWTVSPTTIGGPEQVRVGPSIPRCQAIKVRITAKSLSGTWSEAVKLTGLALRVGVSESNNLRLPVAQKD